MIFFYISDMDLSQISPTKKNETVLSEITKLLQKLEENTQTKSQ